jgi:hypothetical protein
MLIAYDDAVKALMGILKRLRCDSLYAVPAPFVIARSEYRAMSSDVSPGLSSTMGLYPLRLTSSTRLYPVEIASTIIIFLIALLMDLRNCYRINLHF